MRAGEFDSLPVKLVHPRSSGERQNARPGVQRMTPRQVAATRREIEAALCVKQHPWAHKRLVAIEAVFAGKGFWAAAQAARTTPEKVRRWLQQVQLGGCEALLRNRNRAGRPRRPRIADRIIAATREEIEAALAAEARHPVRKRLIAIRAVIEGQTLKAAARSADATPDSVSRWLRLVQAHGCAALLRDRHTAGPRPLPMPPPQMAEARQPIDADAAALLQDVEAALATENRHWARKRLVAVRAVLSGETYAAGARNAGATSASVSRWFRSIRKDGCSGLLRRAPWHDFFLGMTPQQIAAARQEIEAALAGTRPRHLRKRLAAVHAVLRGESIAAAARMAGANPNSLRRWLRAVGQAGCAALLRHPNLGRPVSMVTTPRQIAAARKAINEMLGRQLKPAHQRRLRALDLALSGKLDEAGAIARMQPLTIRRWLLALHRRGVSAYLRQFDAASRRRRLDADPAMLRGLARKAKFVFIRKRFLALSYLAEGFSVPDAAVRAGLGDAAVHRNLKCFQQGGNAAIRARVCPTQKKKRASHSALSCSG